VENLPQVFCTARQNKPQPNAAARRLLEAAHDGTGIPSPWFQDAILVLKKLKNLTDTGKNQNAALKKCQARYFSKAIWSVDSDAPCVAKQI
jgi:hypothetical protein